MTRWQGCPLVNPYCPDDLCVLPADGHVTHRLGTDGGDDRHRVTKRKPRRPTEYDWASLWIGPAGATEEELIRLGAWSARRLWPEQFS